MLALDLSQDPGRHRLASANPAARPARSASRAGADCRPPTPYSRSSALMPVGMSGLFLDQPIALATWRGAHPPAQALGTRDDPHHPRLTAADTPSGSAASARHRSGRSSPAGPADPPQCSQDRITWFVIPAASSKPMQPKPIVASLVAARHRRYCSQCPRRPLADALDQRQQVQHDRRSPPYGATSDPCPGCDIVTNQLFRLSSIATKIVLTSFRDGRAYGGMLASDVSVGFESANPNLTDARPSPHGIYNLRCWPIARRSAWDRRARRCSA